jgi:hypothetical protein
MSKLAKMLLGPLAGGTIYDSPIARLLDIKSPSEKRRIAAAEEEANKGRMAGAGEGMRKGGKVKYAAATAVHKHERNMHKGKPLTKMAKGGKVTRGDGIAKKGHTKGRTV